MFFLIFPTGRSVHVSVIVIYCCQFSKGAGKCHYVGMTKAVLANVVNSKYTMTMKTLAIVQSLLEVSPGLHPSIVWPFRNLEVVWLEQCRFHFSV